MCTINVAIVGVGLIGTLYSRICKQLYGVNLAAVVDVDPTRVETLAKELSVRAVVGDCRRLLEEVPSVDVIFICTPEAYHRQSALDALEAGKHVMIEKPLASTSADAQVLLEAAKSAAGKVMVAYSLRFDPRYVALKNAVSAGEVGRLTHIYAQRNPSRAALDRIKGRVELPFWVGVHDIDMMRWITESEVVRVYASASDVGFEELGVKGSILTNLEFDNGSIAVLENSWRATSTSSRQLSTASFQVHGTGGEIEIRSTDQGVRIYSESSIYNPDVINMPEVHGHIRGTYTNQLDYFFTCVREDRSPGITAYDGYKGVQVVEAILKSIEKRQPVEVV